MPSAFLLGEEVNPHPSTNNSIDVLAFDPDDPTLIVIELANLTLDPSGNSEIVIINGNSNTPAGSISVPPGVGFAERPSGLAVNQGIDPDHVLRALRQPNREVAGDPRGTLLLAPVVLELEDHAPGALDGLAEPVGGATDPVELQIRVQGEPVVSVRRQEVPPLVAARRFGCAPRGPASA